MGNISVFFLVKSLLFIYLVIELFSVTLLKIYQDTEAILAIQI